MPDSIGQSSPGQIGGGGDWLERVKQFGRFVTSKIGMIGSVEVKHELKPGEGELAKRGISTSSGRVGNGANVFARESEKISTSDRGRVAQTFSEGPSSAAVVRVSKQANAQVVDVPFTRELDVIDQLLAQHQSGVMSASQIEQTLVAALDNPDLHLIDALNHLNKEGQLDGVLDALPMASVVTLGASDGELGEHIFGQLQPVTWDAFEEKRWDASADEGFGGAPVGGYEGEGGYLQRRIADLDFSVMSSTERAQVQGQFQQLMTALYDVYNR